MIRCRMHGLARPEWSNAICQTPLRRWHQWPDDEMCAQLVSPVGFDGVRADSGTVR